MVPCVKEIVDAVSLTGTMRVFVYGTLKSGQPNHRLIEGETRGHCKRIGKAVTNDKFPLVVASRYNVPYLLYKPGIGKPVEGEVYEVDEERLAILDDLENHPKYYERKPVEVRLVTHAQNEKTEPQTILCDAYFLVKFVDHLLQLPMLESYHDLWHDLKYVPPSDHPRGSYWWHEVHTGYEKEDA